MHSGCTGRFARCEQAGRRLSRTKARKRLEINALKRELDSKGIVVRAGSAKGLLEEAPAAYKDVTSVVDVIASSNVARTVARLVPVAVVKG